MRGGSWIAAALLAAGCEPGPAPSSGSAAASVSAAASAVALHQADLVVAEKTSLMDRQPVDRAAALAARPQILAALEQARKLRNAQQPNDALARLAAVSLLDPTGAVLALEFGKTARAANAGDRARHFARVALALAQGNLELSQAARKLLTKVGGPPPGASFKAAAAGPASARAAASTAPLAGGALATPSAPWGEPHLTLQAACAALETNPAGGRPLANVSAPGPRGAKCVIERRLRIGAERLQEAAVLATTLGGQGSLRRAWVALVTDAGVHLYGPVARVFTPDRYHLSNDFVVDLQRVNVLGGRTPEVVVKVSERRTFADVALNEYYERDRTRVMLLAVDRGQLELSREVVLAQRELRERVGAEKLTLPTGYAHTPALGQSRWFEMRVAWGAPNQMTVSKVSGNAEPPDEGTIQLFAEPPPDPAGAQSAR